MCRVEPSTRAVRLCYVATLSSVPESCALSYAKQGPVPGLLSCSVSVNNTKFRTRAMCMVLYELGPIPGLRGYAVGREVWALCQSR